MIDEDVLYRSLSVRHGKAVAELQDKPETERLLGRKEAYEELLNLLDSDEFGEETDAPHGDVRPYQKVSESIRNYEDSLGLDFEDN